MDDEARALAATARTLRTLADGTVRVQFDFEPRDGEAAMRLFGFPGTTAAIARLREAVDGPGGNPKAPSLPAPVNEPGENARPYANHARALHASGFFRSPHVWSSTGTDDEYLGWLKTQRCAARSSRCDGQIVPAHVRRIAAGSGVGLKPEFHAIPLCNAHHQLQHGKGESAVMPRERWDKLVADNLAAWCKDMIKADLGFESLTQVPPADLYRWCEDRDLTRYLPDCYRNLEGD